MGGQQRRLAVGVDGEGVLAQPRNFRPVDLAAGGQHQTIIGEGDGAAGGIHRDALPGEVDGAGLALDEADADGIQDLGEGHAHGTEVGLVVAHADGVPGIAVDDGDSHFVGADAHLVEPPRRADGAPQPGEAGADDDDVLHKRCSGGSRPRRVFSDPLRISTARP